MSCDPAWNLDLAEPPPQSVGQFQKYEAAFRLNGPYRNPFDPDEVDAQAVFVPPSGREVRVPAFAYGREACLWKVRFAPRELGRYRARLVIRQAGAPGELALPPFEVTPSDSRGFVHCTPEKPGRFQFEAGGMFLPISIVLWGAYLRDHWDHLPQLRQAGINHLRILIGEKHAGGAYAFERLGLPVGQYDLERARALDRLVDRLDDLDMYLTLNLIEHAEFRVTEPYHWFLDNPYHARNGGPCERPSDFFSSPEARKLFQRWLRYLSARWGYSPRLLMLQLWAEVDFSDGYAADPAAVQAWHRQMADYIHRIDPYGHLVSTSVTFRGVAAAYDRAGLFDLPSIDVAATELYNERDMAEAVRQDALHVMSTYRKPQLLVECGLQHEMFADDRDAGGAHMHAALWASVMSGAAGSPSFWWWQKILDQDLLGHFSALARYLDGEDLLGLRPFEAQAIVYIAAPAEPVFGDLSAPMPVDETVWSRAPGPPGDPLTLAIPNDRPLLATPVPRTLPPHRPVVFDVDYAADGEFVLTGWWLPDTGVAEVRARLDGAEALSLDLLGVGWDKRFTRYREYLGMPYSFPVPKGKHRITLENTGDAWVTISLDFCNYLRPDAPNLRAFLIGDSARAYLWLSNRDSTWWRNRMGKAPRPISGAAVTLDDMKPGIYDVEWWDTCTGALSSRDRAVANSGGELTLALPTVVRDVACKLRWKAAGISVE